MSDRLPKSTGRWVGALFAALFALYAAGACPTIYVGDSGELVAAVHVLGIPHPSGYPLYVLLGKLWTLLVPLGSIAYRMSLFSAFFAAAACAGLFALARALGLGRAPALLSALLLGLAPSFWGEANVQRVYALNAAFVLAASAGAARWHATRRDRDLLFAFFVCGLGAANHTILVFVAAALGAFAVAVEPSLRTRPLLVAKAGAAFASGLLPYAYLLLRSHSDPPLDWGNPETLGALLRVFTRRDFWERSWAEGPLDVVVVALDDLGGIARELTPAGAMLAAAGVVPAWRRDRFALFPLLVAGANFAALALHGSRSDLFLWHRYYIPTYVMAALFAGFGAQWLLGQAPRLLRLAPLAIPALLLASGWREFDRSRYAIAEDFSRRLLASLAPGAKLAASDDNVLFVLIYLQFVEGVRPDVHLILEGVGGAEIAPLRFLPERDALYFTHHPNWTLPEVAIVPVGLAFRIWRPELPSPPFAVPPPHLEGELDPDVPKDDLTRGLLGHFHYMRGLTLEGRDWPAAHAELVRAAEVGHDNDVLLYNLGLIYERAGLFDDALEAFEKSHALNPRHLASRSRVRPADRVTAIARERDRVAALVHSVAGDAELAGFDAGSAAYYHELSRRLGERGEAVAARGYALRALEAAARDRTR